MLTVRITVVRAPVGIGVVEGVGVGEVGPVVAVAPEVALLLILVRFVHCHFFSALSLGVVWDEPGN